MKTINVSQDVINDFQLFPDVHDHMSEVQPLGQQEVEHRQGGAPGIDFWPNLLKQIC